LKARASWIALRFDDGAGVVFLIVPEFGFEVLDDICWSAVPDNHGPVLVLSYNHAL
jgi:hypothetical protein